MAHSAGHGRIQRMAVHLVIHPALSYDLFGSGYAGQPFAQGVQEILGGRVTVQIAKRNTFLESRR